MSALAWRNWHRNYLTLKKAHAALSQGLPPPPSPGPRKSILREKGLFLISAVLLIFGFFIHSYDILNPLVGIPLSRFPANYVSLQDLEQEPVYPWEELFEEHSVFDGPENYADVDFSLLSPRLVLGDPGGVQPHSRHHGKRQFPRPGRRQIPLRPRPGYDLFPSAHSLPGQAHCPGPDGHYRLVNLWWEYEEVDYPGLDFVILATAQDEPWQMTAVGKGGKVAVFRYAGQQRLEECLEVLSTMVQ